MFYDDLDDTDGLPRIKNMPVERARPVKQAKPNHKPKRSQVLAQLDAQRDDLHDYAFSYDASRHERQWIMDSLGGFYEMQWFSDVLRLLQGGKEASVYQCLAAEASPVAERFIAAKVYRPRRFRNLKNDFLYREGRDDLDADGNVVIDDGMIHAMRKRSDYGRQLLHTSWIEHEYQALQVLHAAGADVPEPYTRGDNAILMTYIGDDELPAPTLNTVDLTPGEARPLFERVLHNVEILLAHGRVHGDLSAFNILYWEGEITLIDFPQAISPHDNRSAYQIFERDLTRVCEYFAHQGVRANPRQLATKMWKGQHYRLNPDFNLRFLDPENEGDRRYWEKYK